MGRKRLTTDEFTQKSRKVHGNRYDYSEVNYLSSNSKVIITCKKHGNFTQTPKHHLSGSNCPQCSFDKTNKDNTKTIETFILEANKIHSNKYDYSKVKYVNNKTKIIIICPTHGKFSQSPYIHLNTCGCRKCYLKTFNPYKDKTKTLHNDFIEKSNSIHDNKYDYSEVEYETNIKDVTIICPTHGKFHQPPNSHLKGKGCPICKESHGERDIRKILKENNINFISQHRFNNCRDVLPLPFDFYLPEHNICVEYNGEQHYEPVKIFGGLSGFKDRGIKDKIKLNYCTNNGIELIVVKYNDNIISKLEYIINI